MVKLVLSMKAKEVLPREKANTLGIHTLNFEELVALILGTGNRKENVFELSQRIVSLLMKHTQIKEGLSPRTYAYIKNLLLEQEQNIGSVKTYRLLAAFELAYRIARGVVGVHISGTEDLLTHVAFLKFKKNEYVYGLYLDIANRLILKQQLFKGTPRSIDLFLPQIFRPAILYGAYGFYLVHNHPSGRCKPSSYDVEATQSIKMAAEVLQIVFFDHVIIGKNCYFSFKGVVL